VYFEQRKDERVRCRASVNIHNDTNTWETTLVDVNRTGLQVKRPAGWLLGDAAIRCDVFVGKKLKLHIDTCIVHCGEDFIGLHGNNDDLNCLCDLLKLLKIKLARKRAGGTTQ
jgi:hypothetical protein